MFRVLEYLDSRGRSPFRRWFNRLDPQTAGRVTTALYRMEQGNLSNAKSLGAGLEEYRIDTGPGYRLYFGRQGNTALVILGAGTKSSQGRDIEACRRRWQQHQRLWKS